MFSRCEPRGTYRFQVTGRASKDGSVEPYTLTSRSFELKAATIDADAPAVTGTVATLRARYPNPGENALIVLPRLVTKGTATLMAGGQQVTAKPDAATGAFKATVPAGSKVTLKSLEDGCGNAAG
jgi:hypothetical protein